MKALSNRVLASLIALCVLILPACEGEQQIGENGLDTLGMGEVDEMEPDTLETAFANLEPTEGNDVSGTVSFTEAPEGVRVVASITGLTEGQHGFHVHETGDCSASDASSAGGHYAPEGSPHGAPTDPADQRHMGDLGNVEAGTVGSATYERVDEHLSLNGPNSIVGKAVVVHADADDLESQPSGNAGARVACGVIMEGSNGMDGGMNQAMPGDTTTDM